MSELYRPYHLTDNPFPLDSSLNLTHPDRRINGSIFNEEIFEEELRELDKRLRRRINLIYCQNRSEFILGVGKSAIIAHTWRKYREKGSNVTSVYIRSQKKHTPAIMAGQVISEWHREGFFWTTLAQCLERYVQAVPSPEIRPEGAKLLVEQKWPVDRVDLRSFLCHNPARLMRSLTAWACGERRALSPDIAAAFFEGYLTSPWDFLTAYPKALRKFKWDEIEMLRNTLELMDLGGFEYHYLFFDQFEDPIHGLRGKELIEFSSEMRRLLEAGIGRVSIIATLHPGAETTLEAPEGQEFTTLAPLDGRHRVLVKLLKPCDAESLAVTYLQEFRTDTPPDPLFPLTSEAVQHIHKVTEGNIRKILTGFSFCIEEGADAGHPLVTLEFVHGKHEEILAKISPKHISLS